MMDTVDDTGAAIDTGGSEGNSGSSPTAGGQEGSAAGKVADGSGDEGAGVPQGNDGKTDAVVPPSDIDWRAVAVSGLPEDQRGKASNYLKSRSSMHDVLRSAMAADAKISELTANRGVKIPTGKNDDPKALEEYRKAKGVPDDIEKYNFDVPQEYGALSDLDTELKGDFLKRAQAANWNNQDLKVATDMWWQAQKMYAAEQAKQAAILQQEAMDEIRIEFGKDYRGKVENINRMMSQEMARVGVEDPAQRHQALSIKLADGRTLGDVPWFVRMMDNFATERSDAGAFVEGETSDGGDLDARITKIVALSQTNPKEYERMQPELDKLIMARNRRANR